MYKKEYSNVEVEVVMFEHIDVLAASGTTTKEYQIPAVPAEYSSLLDS